MHTFDLALDRHFYIGKSVMQLEILFPISHPVLFRGYGIAPLLHVNLYLGREDRIYLAFLILYPKKQGYHVLVLILFSDIESGESL